MLSLLTEKLIGRVELSEAEVVVAVERMTQESVSTDAKANFLIALAQKGESIREITVFARELSRKAIPPPIDAATRQRGILDVCGTGGDRLHTFNISTTVSFILAAGGVTVAKHGNRAITSRSGSADVLEALGIPTTLAPPAAAQSLREHQFAFFFAPNYHPAFKHIAPARRLCAERGQRTIFNFLGPLLNPAYPTAQLIGVPQPQLCEPLAHVLQSLGLQRGLVVSGRAGEAWLDEVSTLGENVMAEFAPGREFCCGTSSFAPLIFQPASLADLAGGDAAANARILRRVLAGEETGPRREIVLLNAAAAFCLVGKSPNLIEGWSLAAQLIDYGQAAAKLNEIAAAGPALKHESL
jgi:anthranilate phosphoribosyltransferase